MKNEEDMNIEKLNEELSQMQSYMAESEWYKDRCKRHYSYYDSFKQHMEQQDQHVNLAHIKYEIVEKEEKHVLPSDFRCQNKWINAGTTYKRLV
ncbi:hypothetical protein SUGI_0362660 [Cryptomeria japonica]|nr:hypothetical protein SUGI_0362660 [Cryptomeria japonica]